MFMLLLTSAAVLGAQEGGPEGIQDTAEADEAGTDTTPAGDSTEDPTAPEASPYLIDMQVGDSDLALTWDGYWRIGFSAGGGFGRLREESIFTGLSRGANFYQEPDITLSLWLKNRWFIETTFLEGFDRNTYRAGYMGAPGEFVREVTVGNAGVNATGYAEIDVPAPNYNTPGIVGKFGTDTTDHQLLVRYDPTELQEKYFQGEYEVNTQDIGLPAFVTGRYFILPDEDISDISVYLEDRQGTIPGTDGLGVERYYRLAEEVEYFYDGASGLVALNEAQTGQVVVYYESAVGGPVGSVGGGVGFIVPPDANLHPDVTGTLEDFDWDTVNPYDPSGSLTYRETSSVDIDNDLDPGNDALIIYDPGGFTPFERQNVYESSRPLPEETWRIVPLVRDRGSLYPETTPDYGFIPDTVERTIAVYGITNPSGWDHALRHPENRYPFAGSDPEVYGPGRETDMDKLSRIIVLAIREENPGFYLGSGVVPGSVIVRVNGVRDKTVEISDNGSIEFNRFVYLDDWIEVEYRTETLDLDGGDLFIYQGNSFDLAPRLSLELAESLRWNLSQQRASEEYDQSPGVINVASSLDWQADRAALRLTGDTSLTTPDTAGNLRLFGMDGGRLRMIFLAETLVGPPTDFPSSSPGGTRTEAEQYDYVYTGILGTETLNNYQWPDAEATGEDAPGLAASLGNDGIDSRVAEVRFDLDDSGNEWTSGDILADYGGPVDLSGYTSIEFPLLLLDDYGGSTDWSSADNPPKIYLQAGEIGEGEDHHGDGVVDGIDPGAMVEWDLSSVLESGDPVQEAWDNLGEARTVSITLSPSDRALLGSVRAFRIFIENNIAGPGQPISGRLITGAMEFTGSSFRTEVRTGTDLSTDQTIAADETDNATAQALLTDYPETSVLFHPDDEDNESLRIRWGGKVPGGGGLTDGDRWEAVSWFDGVPLEAYRTLVFYVNNTDGTGGMTASATDSDGKGVTVSWDDSIAGDGWDRITVSIADETAESALYGTISDAQVSVDTDAGEISRFVLTFDDAGTVTTGEVYLDEIHFSDPAYAVTAGGELQASWRYEEDVLAAGTFPFLGNISADGRVQVAGGSVLSGLNRSNVAVAASMSLAADILGMGLDTDWRTTWNGGDADWSGSHNLRIPARWNVFWIEDTYARGVGDGEVSFSRGNKVNLALGPGSIRLSADALYDGASFIQGWGGSTTWGGKFWNAGLEISYILNTDETPESSGDYFSSWIRDYSYLLPSEGTVDNREAHHTADLGLNFGPFSLEWTPELRIKAARSPSWNQENRWAGTLSMPLRFAKWNLTASYRRDLRQTVDADGRNGSYGDAWGLFTDSVGGQFPFTTYVPFGELMGSGDGERFAEATDGMSTADYEAEFAVNMSRNPGSRIYDLFLPNTGEFSMERRYQRKGDTVGWENEWRGSASFSAINLFGNFGRFPIFGFYNTEEISSLVQLTLEDYNGMYFPNASDLTMQTNWAFTGNRDRKFIMDYRVALNWDEDARNTVHEGRLEYQWRTASRDSLRLPLIKRIIPRQHHLENKERISIRGDHPWKDAADPDADDYGFMIYHETSWVFQDAGLLRGWLAIGLGEADNAFTNGWELGLEAEIRF